MGWSYIRGGGGGLIIGRIIGRIFAFEIWGAYILEGLLFFFFFGGGANYRNFTVIVNICLY